MVDGSFVCYFHYVKVDSGVISVEYSAEQQSGGRLSVVDEVSYASHFIGIWHYGVSV